MPDMQAIMLGPTAAAQWQELVHQAAANCGTRLDEELESYLVFLLMRYAERPQLAEAVMALEYLRSQLQAGAVRTEQLRQVGDQCLLYSGLFPLRARRRRVQVRYYVDLGRSAYDQLSDHIRAGWAQVFARLSEDFICLMEVLHAMRFLDPHTRLDDLAVLELWEECGSRSARRELQRRHGARLRSDPGDKVH